MRLQLLSDLHLETEVFEPAPAPGAELLVLAGDIDSRWDALERFAGWPQPVLMVAGNHEFDRREWNDAWPQLRARCTRLGIRLLERESCVLADRGGRRIRFVGTTRWSDFDLFGPEERERAVRAATYFVRVMQASRDGRPFDADAVRAEALDCRAWLHATLREPPADESGADATVVVTHYAPSARSLDPRYGGQPGSSSFCNADDDLLPYADLWLHGHLHCRHDYRVEHAPGSARRSTRVVSNARGLARKGEAEGHDPLLCIDV
ncbi:MAG TPA: metallophosphoesterase [Methylibium sp.]|uniref:metallophosphoesterase n=1 Tax=Methylibium sp. TaxID=2067992 RepID=UPI002DB7DE9B|nr:metallophosphoesterase [Methylibium sp.]HEU4458623.1 metallophosphoesterase [Methylibium sp.]